MNSANESQKKAENPLENVKSYLDEKFKAKEKEIKLPQMTWDEMEIFFKTKVVPVYKKIHDYISTYKFDDLQYNVHRRVATLRIAETLTLFAFKVDIDNGGRQIDIFYELSYRTYQKKKLNKIRQLESETIPFKEIDKINEELLLSLFSKWYTNKEKTIENYIERMRIWKEKQEQKNS